MATKPTKAPAAAQAAIPANLDMAALFQQFLAAQATAAPAKSAQVAAPVAPATPVQVTVTQLGKSWASKQGNMMIAVRGQLPNGATVGGNLWIKA